MRGDPRQTSDPGRRVFAQADQFHQAGRLDEAERLYRQVLAAQPRHADSLDRLGVIAYQRGQADTAIEYLRAAIACDSGAAAPHSHLSLVLAAVGRLEDAAACCRTALKLDRGNVEAHLNLGVILMRLGRWEEAVSSCEMAVALAPGLPDVHNNLGNALRGLGRTDQAMGCFRQALALAPDFAEAHSNLGNALMDLDRAGEAAVHLRRAVALAPDFADAHNNLGTALSRLGLADEAAGHYRMAVRLDPRFAKALGNLGGYFRARGKPGAAITYFEQALGIDPDQPEILGGLALAHLARNDAAAALAAIARALAIADGPENRRIFVECAKSVAPSGETEALRPLLLRALDERWGRPDDLAAVCAGLVKAGPAVARLIARGGAPFGSDGVAALAGEPLLNALLPLAPNVDMALERLLTEARRYLLQAVLNSLPGDMEEGAGAFLAVLAQQCFINEYVFFCADDEAGMADRAREVLSRALGEGGAVPPALVAAVAAYHPLGSVPRGHVLLERVWPAPVEAVLTQQIREPDEERRLRAQIACLTAVADPVSRAVQAQYEENPYPRWISIADGAPPKTVETHLRDLFALADIAPRPPGEGLDILVAGCGTGRNALETARKFRGARTLAIDLSLASLAYAKRKSSGPDGAGIVYMQADILELKAAGRQFDLIEAVGVLHHLSDPFAGWRSLLSVLRPGGFMKLGLYSRMARRKLAHARSLAAAMGPGRTPGAIRRIRRLLAESQDSGLDIVERPDFYTVSNCRDLLFHVEEHAFTLAEIAEFLAGHGLRLLGFEADDAVLAAYRQAFPDDPAAVDLARWQRFEDDHPDVFSSMYQFWVQKA